MASQELSYLPHVLKMRVTEMRILRWMCGHARRYKIRNEVIRDKMRVVPVEDKMQEVKLRWFDHVKRRCGDVPGRRCERLGVVGLMKGRGRLKKY